MTVLVWTYTEAKFHRDALEARVAALGYALNQYPKNEIGLTLDEAKDDEWRRLRALYANRFKELQGVNRYISKNFRKEVRAEIAAKRLAQLQTLA